MQCNQAGLDLIKSFEGCRLTSYQDQAGLWTIGYGHCTPAVTEGLTITQDQADNWLASDVSNTAASLSRMIKVAVNGNQFSALCSLAFNIGTGHFAGSSALALLNEGYIDQVPGHMELWNKVNGVTDAGLVRRRIAEAALFQTPIES